MCLFFLRGQHQPQRVHTSTMFRARRHNIDPCGVDAAVSKHICQLGDIFLYGVKAPGKEMAEIVRKYLLPLYIRIPAQRFHHLPDIRPIQRLAASCHENWSGADTGFPNVSLQRPLQFTGQQNHAGFPLELNDRFPLSDCLRCDIAQFRYPYARSADRLQEQQQLFVFPLFCRSLSLYARTCSLVILSPPA